VKQTFATLKSGQGVVHSAASAFENITQAGWTGTTTASFSELRRWVARAGGKGPLLPSDRTFERRDQGVVGLEVATDGHDVGSLFGGNLAGWISKNTVRLGVLHDIWT
jgi:hypothetical protein